MDLLEKSFVIVVLFVFGGLYKIKDKYFFFFIILVNMLCLFSKWFCLYILLKFLGCMWFVSGFMIDFFDLLYYVWYLKIVVM